MHWGLGSYYPLDADFEEDDLKLKYYAFTVECTLKEL